MFNSLLNRKEKMGFVLFWWLIIVLSIGLGIQFYKWIFPQKFITTETKIEYQYKDLGQVKLEDLILGQSVKWQGNNLFVSSITTNNLIKSTIDEETPVQIYLRREGECK